MNNNHLTELPVDLRPIIYGLVAPSEIIAKSAVEVNKIDTSGTDVQGLRNSLSDPLLTETASMADSDFISKQFETDHGAFGHISLELPVIHTGFIDLVKTALNCSCNNCGRVLLYENPGTHPSDETKSERDYYQSLLDATIRDHGQTSREHSSLVKEIELTCMSDERVNCMHCGEVHKTVTYDMPWTFKANDSGDNPTNISANEIFEWLKRIPDNELIFIGLGKTKARPEWAIMTAIPVPPLAFRPTILINEHHSVDDLTDKLVDIVMTNQRLKDMLNNGKFQIVIDDLHTLLQYHCTTYFDNQTNGIPPARNKSGRPLKTLAQRVKGDSSPFKVDFNRSNLKASVGGDN